MRRLFHQRSVLKYTGCFLPVFPLFLLLFSVSCPVFAGEDPFAGLSGTLRIVGSNVGLVPARQAAEKIMAAHPGITITVTMTGAGTGNRQVSLRQADLCLYDRDPGDSAHHGAPLTYVAYGVDPMAVVVNPVNPVGPALNAARIRDLFGGRVKLWSEVGGEPVAVEPMYVEASEVEDRPDNRGNNISVSSQQAMVFMVVRNRGLMGCVSLRDLDAALKPLGVDGVMPGIEAFRQGRYRVYRMMFATYDAARPSLAQAFLKYMQSPEGQQLLVAAGYLPLAEKPAWESVIPVGQPSRLALGQ